MNTNKNTNSVLGWQRITANLGGIEGRQPQTEKLHGLSIFRRTYAPFGSHRGADQFSKLKGVLTARGFVYGELIGVKNSGPIPLAVKVQAIRRQTAAVP
jgi:hypothetical protein